MDYPKVINSGNLVWRNDTKTIGEGTPKMAVATIVESEVRFSLNSCPPDGFVVIRRMTYGERLRRQGMMSKMRMDMGDRKTGGNPVAEFEMFHEQVSAWEFANLVVQHNLTDANNKPLNFKNVADVHRIRGQVGDEITQYINKINEFEEEEEVKNS